MSDRQAMRRGDGKTLRLLVIDADGAASDLSDVAEIVFALSRRLGAATEIEKTLTGGGVAIADAGAGIIEVTLDGDDTEELPAGSYYFEVQMTDTNGIRTTLEFSSNRILIEGDQIRA